MANELGKLGCEVIVNENDVIVNKISKIKSDATLFCHNDHRIAMSLAIVLTTVGGTLMGCECVKKSYPHFFEDLRSLGIKWEEV
jgi:3-phosphoshikimate 1-carboxyvinyltransferase